MSADKIHSKKKKKKLALVGKHVFPIRAIQRFFALPQEFGWGAVASPQVLFFFRWTLRRPIWGGLHVEITFTPGCVSLWLQEQINTW